MKFLSAIYLFKDEEEFLPLSVSTVWDYVDEVILINTKSTDNSLQLARELEAQRPNVVRVYDWPYDFDQHKEYVCRNESLKLARGKWLMIMDADQLMSDGWRKQVDKYLKNPGCDALSVKYEHYVGSYRHIHREFYEKQKDPSLHKQVPLIQMVFFRKTKQLRCMPAAWSCPQFREFHHARFNESVDASRRQECWDATIFHYGFSKKNMMYMAEYRIRRGDYGHEDETKERMIKELHESNNPFKFIGWVHPVDYGPEGAPWPLRDRFHDYELTLDYAGRIMKRVHLPTGIVG
jgi:glycosyltransferase involved in cell wall biosynthesis